MPPRLGLWIAPICLAAVAFSLNAQPSAVYLRLTDALTLDPGKYQDFYSGEVIANIFEGLVRLQKNAIAVEAALAERWEVKDRGRRWIFFLRRGVRFHDGRPFDSRAVVYSFKKRMEKKEGEYRTWGLFFPYISAIRSLDDFSVEILLSRPYHSFLFALVDPRSYIVEENAYAAPEFKPVGTGPFRFVEWVRNRHLVLSPNPQYWGGEPHLGKIRFQFEPDAAKRMTELKNDSAQISVIRSAREFEELVGRKDIAILSKPSLSTHYLAFNSRREPFNRLPVRQVFAHLIEKKGMVRRVFQNFASPASSLLPEGIFGFSPLIDDSSFDPQAARRLLNDAGLKRGFVCTLFISEGQFGIEEIAKILSRNARNLNTTVKVIKLPFPVFLRAIQSGDADMFIAGWGFTVDPGIFLNPLFLFAGKSDAHQLYRNPRLDDALTQAEQSLVPVEQEKWYVAAQQIIRADLPLIPLFHLNDMVAHSRRIKSLGMNAFGYLLFRDAFWETR